MQHTFRSGLDRGNFPNAVQPSPPQPSTVGSAPTEIRAIMATATAALASDPGLGNSYGQNGNNYVRVATPMAATASGTAVATGRVGNPSYGSERRRWPRWQHLRRSQRLWPIRLWAGNRGPQATGRPQQYGGTQRVCPGPIRTYGGQQAYAGGQQPMAEREQPPVLRLLVGRLQPSAAELRHASRLRRQQRQPYRAPHRATARDDKSLL